MPRGVAALGGSGVLLLGLGAVASILMSMGLAYGAWDLHRRIRNRSIRNLKNEHILQPPPRTSPEEPDTLELGNAFRKGEAHENEPYVLMPHNLASYLPSTPPRAHVSDFSPLTPPGLPPCKASSSARMPILVLTNAPRTHKSVELTFGHTEIYNPKQKMQTAARESDFIFRRRMATDGPISKLGLGLILSEDEEFPEEFTYPGSEETHLIESVTSDSPGNFLDTRPDPIPPTQSSSQPVSPFITSNLPTLVITSASMHRGWNVGEGILEKGTLPSPPQTPTLILTSPSIHCGLDADPEERLACWDDPQNWSEVLELEEYDDEAGALLGSLSYNPKQLETPPQTPIFLQMPAPRSRIRPMPLSIDEGYRFIHGPDQDTPDNRLTEDAEIPFDYAAFHARLAAFNLTHRRVKPEERFADNERLARYFAASPPEISRLDYESLRARKRAATVSTKPGPNPPSISIPSPRAARCAARPRPLPLRRPGYI